MWPIGQVQPSHLFLFCGTDDKNLPSVPPLQLSIPADYPEQSPQWSDDGQQYGETPVYTVNPATQSCWQTAQNGALSYTDHIVRLSLSVSQIPTVSCRTSRRTWRPNSCSFQTNTHWQNFSTLGLRVSDRPVCQPPENQTAPSSEPRPYSPDITHCSALTPLSLICTSWSLRNWTKVFPRWIKNISRDVFVYWTATRGLWSATTIRQFFLLLFLLLNCLAISFWWTPENFLF